MSRTGSYRSVVAPTRTIGPVDVVTKINLRGRARTRRTARAVANAVVRIIRKNITTQMGGTWAPLRCRYGKALSRRKRDWKVKREDEKYTVFAEPFWWVTHLEGRTIRAKRAQALRFMCHGRVMFRKWVVIPRRDPRPTVTQLRGDLRSEIR